MNVPQIPEIDITQLIDNPLTIALILLGITYIGLRIAFSVSKIRR